MKSVTFRLYGSLNDFVAPARRHRAFVHSVHAGTTVKDAFESLGVPHTEVDLLLAGEESVDFAHRVEDLERVAVFPRFTSLDVADLTRVRPAPLGICRFVLDVHLGRLASYLRLAGFDTFYGNDTQDLVLARLSHDERRILLTRDAPLLKRAIVEHGYFLRSTEPRQQLVEVVERFALAGRLRPFTRCARCNALLEPAEAADVASRVPERARRAFDRFWQCPGCARVYWRGSHWHRVSAWFHDLAQAARTGAPGGRAGGAVDDETGYDRAGT